MVFFLAVILTPLSYYLAQPLRERTEPRPSDAIVLFSSGSIDDRWLSTDAAQRTWGALLLYREGYAPVIVSSGSQHARGLYQAETQAEWLKRAGVPDSALIVESASTRTYESVVELRRLMAEHGWRSAVIVTSELDVPRIRRVIQRMGNMTVSYLAVPTEKPPERGYPTYISHGLPVLYHASYEYAALALYWFKGWI
jgi:uncharacterized SAM-binding protein YcdF (DUF218 family)